MSYPNNPLVSLLSSVSKLLEKLFLKRIDPDFISNLLDSPLSVWISTVILQLRSATE